MPSIKNPGVKLLMVGALGVGLFYLPVREFLKITFIMGIPFVFVLGYMFRQRPKSLTWILSLILLAGILVGYSNLLSQLPERIKVRAIISEGGALVAEGHYQEAIKEYEKLARLDKEETMKSKIETAKKEQQAAYNLARAQTLIEQHKIEEARQILASIPPQTRAGHEAARLIKTLK